MSINDMQYIITPQTMISDLIDYNSIYDEYLDGIEELVEKEMHHYATDILAEEDEDVYNDPQYCPTEISSYRSYKDTDGYVDYFVLKELPSLIRGSAVVTLYSIFEKNIKDICEKFFSFSSMKLKYQYIAGNNALEKLKTVTKILDNKIVFGERIYHINAKLFQESSYKIIEDIRAIRNCFAHANGEIKEEVSKIAFLKNKEIKNYFNVENNQVIIEKRGLNFISVTMRNFYHCILKSKWTS